MFSVVLVFVVLALTTAINFRDKVFNNLDKDTYCNRTILFEEWKLMPYTGALSMDPNFWRYQTQNFITITNGLALDLAAAMCKNEMRKLVTFKAGRSGPIDIQTAWKAMCKRVCLESDYLHNEAMYYSGCSCVELSTLPEALSYTYPGDWCKHNSARLLCDIVGFCGIWNCRIDDFMCPRFEFNKKIIPLKGPGSCIKSAKNSASSLLSSWEYFTMAYIIIVAQSCYFLFT